jgi:hypothetical protein
MNKNEKIFNVYATSLASILHYDIIKTIKNLDDEQAPDIYISKVRSYLKSLSNQDNINNFINFYSSMYDSWIQRETNKLKKIKEFVNIWLPVNRNNNNVLNENYVQLIYKINSGAITVLLQSHFINQADTHIRMYLKSNNPKNIKEVRKFEMDYNNVVRDAIKVSCTRIKHNMDSDADATVPIQQYIALQQEIRRLKETDQSEIIRQLKEEIENLKNKIEILELK